MFLLNLPTQRHEYFRRIKVGERDSVMALDPGWHSF